MAPARQLDLLRDWAPPDPVVRFDDNQVKASSLPVRLCKAISTTLKEASEKRDAIAAKMSDFLGRRISVNMLNAYASAGREDHCIGLASFVALLHATRDRRLLEMIAEPLGWAVIDRRHLPLIELALVREQQVLLQDYAKRLAGAARSGGSRRA